MSKTVIQFVCVLLLIASVALLFIPCWSVKDKDGATQISVGEYVLFPYKNKGMTKALRPALGAKKLSTRVALPVFAVMALGAVAAAVSVMIRHHAPAVCCIVMGIVGLLVYCTNVLLKLSSLWAVGLALHGIMLIVGIVQSILFSRSEEK